MPENKTQVDVTRAATASSGRFRILRTTHSSSSTERCIDFRDHWPLGTRVAIPDRFAQVSSYSDRDQSLRLSDVLRNKTSVSPSFALSKVRCELVVIYGLSSAATASDHAKAAAAITTCIALFMVSSSPVHELSAGRRIGNRSTQLRFFHTL